VSNAMLNLICNERRSSCLKRDLKFNQNMLDLLEGHHSWETQGHHKIELGLCGNVML